MRWHWVRLLRQCWWTFSGAADGGCDVGHTRAFRDARRGWNMAPWRWWIRGRASKDNKSPTFATGEGLSRCGTVIAKSYWKLPSFFFVIFYTCNAIQWFYRWCLEIEITILTCPDPDNGDTRLRIKYSSFNGCASAPLRFVDPPPHDSLLLRNKCLYYIAVLRYLQLAVSHENTKSESCIIIITRLYSARIERYRALRR